MVWVIFRISLCKRVGVCINFTSFSLSGCRGLISSCGQKSTRKCLSLQPFQIGILPLPLLSLTRRIVSLTCIIFGRTTGLLAAVLGRDILSVPYCQKKGMSSGGKDSQNKIYNMVGCINNSDDQDQMLCSPTGIASSYYYSSSTLPQWFL